MPHIAAERAPLTQQYLGVFATDAALQSARPAASYAGGVALVGSAAPYARYFSNGVFWVNADTLNLYSGGNLIANGYGEAASNANFSKWTLDRTYVPEGASAAFRWPTPSAYGPQVPLGDGLIRIDASRLLRVRATCLLGNPDGSQFSGTRLQYLAVVCYDGDFYMVEDAMSSRWAGSALTTLAAPLNDGDTTITVTDATGWQNGGNWYERRIAWWPFIPSYGNHGWQEATGRVHAAYTYTRSVSAGESGAGGTWNAGGISGNVITLNTSQYPAGWTLGHVPAGTPVRNAVGGGALPYLVSGHNTQGITKFDRTFSLDPANSPFLLIPRGTTYVRLEALVNLGGSGIDAVRWSAIDMRYAS